MKRPSWKNCIYWSHWSQTQNAIYVIVCAMYSANAIWKQNAMYSIELEGLPNKKYREAEQKIKKII